MKHNKSLKLVLPILLILLMSIGIFSGCLGNLTTPSSTVPGDTSGDEKVLLRVTYKEINLDEGNFSIEICSLNQYGLNASGFNYTYYDSEGVEITDLANFIGIPFDVVHSTLIGTPGSPTEVNNIPLYFNEVENYFIANPDVKQISCTVNLIGTDSLGNEITELIMSNIPIIESGVEHQEVNAVIQTTPNPPTGEVPLTVHFDAGASTTEDVRGVAKYCWHFGDGSHGTCFTCSCPSNLECPMHTYEEPGTYVATLCVWDFNDNLDCAAVVVTVNAIQMNMTITANPATIAPKETSTISAYLTDQYDNPIPDGTKVAFYTTDGTLSAVFADTVGGIATVDLTLNEPVIATVTAVCDDASGSIIVRAVELGITVTANPVTISPGDSSTISAYLVDTFGEPVPDGTTITFSTNEGTLTSNFALTTDGIATVDLQLSRITVATVTANYGTVSGSTTVTCTDGPIAIIENDTDDQISPIEITANSDCPYTITFNAYKSIIGTSPPLTYQWNMTLPDGSVDNLGTAVVTAPYIFDTCGIYVITLTVEDSCTVPCPHSDTATMRIIVTNPEGPTAVITSSEAIVGSTINIIANSDCAYPVTFWGDYSTTTAICGDIESYSWEIINPGGGSVDTGEVITGGTPAGVRMIHSFDECGTYVVELTVTDGCDRTASTFVTVIVSAPDGPTAVITSPLGSSPIKIEACSDRPYTVFFEGDDSTYSTDCPGLDYAWSITGPDSPSPFDTPDAVTVSYEFDACGDYTVTLMVTDSCSNTNSVSVLVEVSEPAGPMAVISTPPDLGSPVEIEACSDRPYTVVFDGNDSTYNTNCPGLDYAWSITGPDSPSAFDTPDAVTVSYEFDNCGDFTVTLTVTDSCSNTDSVSVIVKVREPEGPVAVITGSPGDIEACSGCPYPVVFDGGDSTYSTDCPGLDYAWSISGPNSPSFDTSDVVTASFEFEDCGVYVITLEVTDGCSNTDSVSVLVEVNEPAGPTIVMTNTTGQIPPIEIDACSTSPYSITFNAGGSTTSVACGDLDFAWEILEPDSTPVTPSTGTDPATITYGFKECGDYTVTLVVTDDCLNTATKVITVRVTCPAGPTIVMTNTTGQIPPIEIDACSTSPYSITFNAGGSTTSVACGDLDFAWEILEPDSTPVTPSTGTDPATITYGFKECGDYTVTLVVTDDCLNTATQVITVRVTCPAGPTIVMTNTTGQIPPIEIDACSTSPYSITFNAGGSTTSVACGDLDFAWEILEPDSTPVTPSTGTDPATITYGFKECGDYTVTLVVTDDCLNTATQVITVRVSDPADPVAAINPSSTINITACSDCPYTYEFDAYNSVSNTPCLDLSYAWSISGGPGTPTLNGAADTVIVNYTFSDWGTYEVTLVVTDGCGNTHSDSVTVSVTDPADPTVVITGSPGNITACSACPYPATFGSTVTGGAPCGAITYAWTMTHPATAADITNANVATANYSFVVCGTYVINLEITDGCGKTAYDSVTVIVSEPGAPTAAFTYAPITSAGHIDTGEEITFDASTSTSDSFCGIVTYDWDWGDGLSDLGITYPITTHTFDTADTVTVELTVTDGCGKTNTKTEVIIVGI